MENVGKEQPQVDYTLNKLEKEIDVLQQNINKLQGNLAQILTIQESKDCVEDGIQNEHNCELAHKINNLYRRIDYINNQIIMIINGLQISPSVIPEISEDKKE